MERAEIELVARYARADVVAWVSRTFGASEEGPLGGQCDKACGYLAECLVSRGGRPTVKRGYVECDAPNLSGALFAPVATTRPRHWWIETDGLLVDITADQFNYMIADPADHFPDVLVVPPSGTWRHVAERDVEAWTPGPDGWPAAFRSLATDV